MGYQADTLRPATDKTGAAAMAAKETASDLRRSIKFSTGPRGRRLERVGEVVASRSRKAGEEESGNPRGAGAANGQTAGGL